MDRLLKFIGLATVILSIGYGILQLKSNNAIFNEALRILGLVALVIIVGYIIARMIWGKNWMIKGGATILVGSDLISAFRLFLGELPAPSKEITANLAGHLVYRFTRLGIFGFLIALIPIVLLWQQNQLLSNQNEKIDAQIELDESSRRGNLVVMMSNIMDSINEEINTVEDRGDSSRVLSTQLIGRIAALSYAFRPYRFWQDSALIENPLSPERGQLLLALVNSDLDTSTYKIIYQESTFTDSYLKHANLSNAYLVGIDLKGSNLNGASLNNTNLSYADIQNSDFGSTDFRGVNLNNTIICDIELLYAKVSNPQWFSNLLEKDQCGFLLKYEVREIHANKDYHIYLRN